MATGEVEPVVKTFNSYEPGFPHLDIKYLPQMPDESARRYLFVAIDRATCWIFMRIYKDQTGRSSIDFLRRLRQAAPTLISKIFTDNGSQFTDRFTAGQRAPSGQNVFDKPCLALNIESRLSPPRHPQTNGMVERFNGRITDVVPQTQFTSAAQLEATLKNYAKTCNNQIPQRALNHLSPVQALKIWQSKRPELFVKRVKDHPGLDTHQSDLAVRPMGRVRQVMPSSLRKFRPAVIAIKSTQQGAAHVWICAECGELCPALPQP